MVQRASIFLVVLFLLPELIPAGTLDHNFEQGNKLYVEGNYSGAITEYEKILRAGYESSQLYYNLGNAYFRDGQLGMAIANYIRARRLAPRDDDIRANLEFAHQFAIDKVEVSEQIILFDYVNRFFDSFSVNEVTVITFILYLLTVAVILLRYVYRRLYIYTPIVVALIMLMSVSVIFTGIKLERDVLTQTGVVLTPQTDVKNGPGDDYTDQFTAHAGLTFKIEREESGYYLVNFENRLKGWIEKEAVARI